MPPVPAVSSQFNAARDRALMLARWRMVALAKTKHAEIMARAPRPAGFLRYVDGRLGVAEEAVKVFGVIHYVYNRPQIGFERNLEATRARLDQVARFAIETLRALSPVGSGRDPHPGLYRDSHALFINKAPVNDLAAWRPGDEISISNGVDYARILEIGDRKSRLPLLVYERALDIVMERHGKDASIEFTWRGQIERQYGRSGPNPWVRVGPKPGRESRKSRRPGAVQNRSEIRYPTLVITPMLAPSGAWRGVLDTAAAIGVPALLASSAFSVSSASRDLPMLNAPGTIDHR